MATSPKAGTKAPAKGAEGAETAKSKSKLPVILVALVLGAAAAGGGTWYFLGQKPATPHKAEKKKVDPGKPPVLLAMEPFTVNLQPDGMGDQYLQVAFSLQVGDEKQLEHLKPYLPQLRSRLLLLLSGKKASEISTVEGKNKLAEEILNLSKQPFSPGGEEQEMSNVFFTSFVIQ
ncbi:flagellar FliL protein [Paucimonas lemoignei]|uniref:Flagellar protein FliL n=1 Tax=Paucimonas lemoignei TaxID=29443 RepID=A0A4V2UJ95_PAULE|nr:flagellar basal body-associated protein FliL [Paucimonas lemoignei]TCS39180.1 flagellar FliL protein [Paucimonas lemoignei]